MTGSQRSPSHSTPGFSFAGLSLVDAWLDDARYFAVLLFAANARLIALD